ncbi:hypothetical protein fugu_006428 [Takifugu bimaculatus]|uniref:Glypican-1 n=1 Tax=Takifugu bimaculatus TaxID=433685 RepID=A0A4Z2B809_9TELE|nr:hypothetical protein fugu_006428 [Takifugu bimaculatus]
MCPQGPTCCTSTMEENLATLSGRETEGLIREAGRSLQAAFNALHRSFDTYFTELHSHSERSLQDALSPLGPLYSQNSRLFGGLYTDLRQYYRGSALNLDETLSEFWSYLLERTFKFSAPTDVNLSEDYLECVAKQQATLRPFGDIPQDMRTKVSLSPECLKGLMKLVYCPYCRGIASVKPCSNYCSNVMKGCLANQADLDPEWQNLIGKIQPLLSGTVVCRFTDAGLYDSLSVCVRLKSEPSLSRRRKSGFLTASEYKPSPTAGIRLEMQVSDLSSKLREMRQYWTQLSAALCNKLAGGGNQSGEMLERHHQSQVMGDGLANQINNPEVELDITKPDMTIREQIMQLKIMSDRLKRALDGNDVDFQDCKYDP